MFCNQKASSKRIETDSLIQEIKVTEAPVRRCSSKWVFLKILQYLLENTCVGA